MTLNSELITSAYRESNFVSQSTDLTADEQAEGLALLQGLVLSMPGLLLGHKYKPWHLPWPNRTTTKSGDYPAKFDKLYEDRDVQYPPVNSRVVLRNQSPTTLFMREMPADGDLMQFVDAGFTGDVTLDANGQYFGTSGVVTTVTLNTSVDGGNRLPTRTYLYRQDIASWVQIDTLVYAAEMPYPVEFDDFWTTQLAMRLSPRFGNEPRQITMMRNKDMQNFVRGWYRRDPEDVIVGDAGVNTHQNWGGPANNDDFRTGSR